MISGFYRSSTVTTPFRLMETQAILCLYKLVDVGGLEPPRPVVKSHMLYLISFTSIINWYPHGESNPDSQDENLMT